MFNLDINRLLLWLLPDFLRKPVIYAYLKVLCWPLLQAYSAFITLRSNNLYKVNHNSQVFSMQAVLNDRFDADQRRIYISDGFTKDRLYIFTSAELKPKYLGKINLWNDSDYSDTGVDFIVWTTGLQLNDQDVIEMKSLIEFYKLAGKRYRIYTA